MEIQYPLYICGIFQAYTATLHIHGIYMVYTDYIPGQGSRCYPKMLCTRCGQAGFEITYSAFSIYIIYFFAYKSRGSPYSAHILHTCCILVILKQGEVPYAKGGFCMPMGVSYFEYSTYESYLTYATYGTYLPHSAYFTYFAYSGYLFKLNKFRIFVQLHIEEEYAEYLKYPFQYSYSVYSAYDQHRRSNALPGTACSALPDEIRTNLYSEQTKHVHSITLAQTCTQYRRWGCEQNIQKATDNLTA